MPGTVGNVGRGAPTCVAVAFAGWPFSEICLVRCGRQQVSRRLRNPVAVRAARTQGASGNGCSGNWLGRPWTVCAGTFLPGQGGPCSGVCHDRTGGGGRWGCAVVISADGTMVPEEAPYADQFAYRCSAPSLGINARGSPARSSVRTRPSGLPP